MKYNTEALHVQRSNQRFQAGTSSHILQQDHFIRNVGTTSEEYSGFLYILAGTGEYICRDTGIRYPFQPGTIFLKEPGLCFDRRHDKGLYIDKYFVLPSAFYNYFIEYSGKKRETCRENIGIRPDLCLRFDELIHELQYQTESKLILTAARFSVFIMELLHPASENTNPYQNEMEKAAKILSSDFSRKISLRDLADQSRMSMTNFRRVFLQHFGTPPNEYRMAKKIEMISSLLKTGNYSNKYLAEHFGYSDPFAFSLQFKKITGLSPKAFREKFQPYRLKQSLDKIMVFH